MYDFSTDLLVTHFEMISLTFLNLAIEFIAFHKPTRKADYINYI